MESIALKWACSVFLIISVFTLSVSIWGEATAPDGQCAMPLALRLSEGLGRTWRLLAWWTLLWPQRIWANAKMRDGEPRKEMR